MRDCSNQQNLRDLNLNKGSRGGPFIAVFANPAGRQRGTGFPVEINFARQTSAHQPWFSSSSFVLLLSLWLTLTTISTDLNVPWVKALISTHLYFYRVGEFSVSHLDRVRKITMIGIWEVSSIFRHSKEISVAGAFQLPIGCLHFSAFPKTSTDWGARCCHSNST